MHLLGNLYFFLLFSAEIEGYMGSLKYAALLVVYAFIHPHQRFAFWVPAAFTLIFGNTGYARIWGRSWVRAPFALVVVLYFADNFLNYIL